MSNKCLLVGRWQPFHKGHKALIQSAINDGMDVVVAVRNTSINEDNPHTYEQRVKMIKEHFPNVEIIKIPDICEIRYGRDVGYRIVKKELSKEIESISATSIRNRESQSFC